MTVQDEISHNEDKLSVTQDVSAPPREIMITTAAHFLQNPRVQNSPMLQRRQFLIKKGLTNEEINLAIERSGVNKEIVQVKPQELVPSSFSQPRALPVSIWTRMNHIGSSVIMVSIALYGIHRFYKLYIEPWLYGSPCKEDRLNRMEEQLLEVNRSLSQLRRIIGGVEETLGAEKEKLCSICKNDMNTNPDLYLNPVVLNDIKAEVASLKSLMLNRRQFPAVPIVNRTIPSWQLSENQEKESEKKETDPEKLEDENTKINLPVGTQKIELKENGVVEIEDEDSSDLYEEKNKIISKQVESDQTIEIVEANDILKVEQMNTSEA